jgi:hypothetical protein
LEKYISHARTASGHFCLSLLNDWAVEKPFAILPVTGLAAFPLGIVHLKGRSEICVDPHPARIPARIFKSIFMGW